MPKQKTKEKDGVTYKYHADGKSVFAKGKIKNGTPDGYWEWFRKDGTKKRSGYFKEGAAVGKWITYDAKGETYKVTEK